MTRDWVLARDSPHLNMFIERSTIEVWAARLGLAVERFIDALAAVEGPDALGQSVVALRKPAA